MGVVIESEVWEPNRPLFIFIFISCCVSIFSLPFVTNKNKAPSSATTATVFDHHSVFLRFQKSFLLLYSLASVLEGLWAAFGEYELAYYGGMSREQMVFSLCVGCAAALFIGSLLGPVADIIGHKKVCLLFCILHLLVGIWKRVIVHSNIWLANICLSLASSIFSFSFEAWIVVEHEKLEQRHDTLNDMFWLMSFLESAFFIGSQMLGNLLIGGREHETLNSPSVAALVLAIIAVIYITQGWKETPRTVAFKDYSATFCTYINDDKRIYLLAWAQACTHFSIAAFWIVWAPTIVADGREVILGLIYPCFMGAKMLGSTSFPWFFGPLSLRTEECLVYAFAIMGLLLSIVAYDYQEICVLVTVFCLFQACMGLVLPSLARLRNMYVPNEIRGGIMSLSLAPANALLLFFLLQGGYYRQIENSTIMSIAALGLFSAAGCMHTLKRTGKHLHGNWHKS